MAEFSGFGLPTQKGDGPAFEQTLQAPPVVRLEVRATQQWFEGRNQKTRQQIGEAIADRYQGVIQQFINGQRQNYQLSNVQLWRKLFSMPGLDIEYTMRAGFETVVIVVYPENQPDDRKLRKVVIEIGDVLAAKFGIDPEDPGYDGSSQSGFFVAWNHPFKGKAKLYYEVHIRKTSFDKPYPTFFIPYGGSPWPNSTKVEDLYAYQDDAGFNVKQQYMRSWLGPRFGLAWFADQPASDETKKYYNGSRSMVMPTGEYGDLSSPFPRAVYVQSWWSTSLMTQTTTTGNPTPTATTIDYYGGNYVRDNAVGGGLGGGMETVLGDGQEYSVVIKGNLAYPSCPTSGALDTPNTSTYGVYGWGCWSGASFETYADKDVYMFAVDTDANKIWVGKNGKWANDADPSKGNETMTLDDVGTGAYYPAMQVDMLNFYGVPGVPSDWNWFGAPMWIESVFAPDALVYSVPPGFAVSKAVEIDIDLPV